MREPRSSLAPPGASGSPSRDALPPTGRASPCWTWTAEAWRRPRARGGGGAWRAGGAARRGGGGGGGGGEAAGRAVGGEAMPVVADVTRAAEVETAVAQVMGRWGRLDIMVNNAGITGRSFPIWELSDEDWQRVIEVDLTSVFFCCRAAVKAMLPRGSGRIINIASIAGKEGNPTLVPYSSAKAGVIGLTKALAREVATRGILVHAVAPAVIGTELLKQMEKSTVDLLISKIPMGRVGTPEEGGRASCRER